MDKTKIATPKAPTAIGPYSQGIIASPLVFVSGQIPTDPLTGQMPEGIEAQTHMVFSHMEAVLNETSLSLNNVVKTTVFLKNLSDFAIMNEIYSGYFDSPFPARSTVEVSDLPKGALIEVECIAYSIVNNKNQLLGDKK